MALVGYEDVEFASVLVTLLTSIAGQEKTHLAYAIA